jgi:hypothetical protein
MNKSQEGFPTPERLFSLGLHVSPFLFAKLGYFEPRFWFKAKGDAVNLEPLAKWGGSIIIDKAEMGLTV